MQKLLNDIKKCTHCMPNLPLGPNPVVSASPKSRIMLIGQAPGTAVHASGIPWDDKSGDNLRGWLGIGKEDFYNPDLIAIMPMGFCYPGRGKSGDLPPRKECAPLWHEKMWSHLNNIQLTILIGQYAQKEYLKGKQKKTLTETVKSFEEYLPGFIVLPHPSPRNNIWRAKNKWFDEAVIPTLKEKVAQIIDKK